MDKKFLAALVVMAAALGPVAPAVWGSDLTLEAALRVDATVMLTNGGSVNLAQSFAQAGGSAQYPVLTPADSMDTQYYADAVVGFGIGPPLMWMAAGNKGFTLGCSLQGESPSGFLLSPGEIRQYAENSILINAYALLHEYSIEPDNPPPMPTFKVNFAGGLTYQGSLIPGGVPFTDATWTITVNGSQYLQIRPDPSGENISYPDQMLNFGLVDVPIDWQPDPSQPGWWNGTGSTTLSASLAIEQVGHTAAPVPLPGALPLLGSGLLGLWGWRRLRKG